jgi:hypothetical protein
VVNFALANVIDIEDRKQAEKEFGQTSSLSTGESTVPMAIYRIVPLIYIFPGRIHRH